MHPTMPATARNRTNSRIVIGMAGAPEATSAGAPAEENSMGDDPDPAPVNVTAPVPMAMSRGVVPAGPVIVVTAVVGVDMARLNRNRGTVQGVTVAVAVAVDDASARDSGEERGCQKSSQHDKPPQ